MKGTPTAVAFALVYGSSPENLGDHADAIEAAYAAHKVSFSGADLPSGTYFYTLRADTI